MACTWCERTISGGNFARDRDGASQQARGETGEHSRSVANNLGTTARTAMVTRPRAILTGLS